MTREQIQQRVADAHKHPFYICTSDGHQVAVAHPDFVFFPPKPHDWEFIVFHADRPGFEVIDVSSVTRLAYRNRGRIKRP
jgi:hypothetical protein